MAQYSAPATDVVVAKPVPIGTDEKREPQARLTRPDWFFVKNRHAIYLHLRRA